MGHDEAGHLEQSVVSDGHGWRVGQPAALLLGHMQGGAVGHIMGGVVDLGEVRVGGVRVGTTILVLAWVVATVVVNSFLYSCCTRPMPFREICCKKNN